MHFQTLNLFVGGWFHGNPYERPSKEQIETDELLEPEDIDEDDFYSWINPMYLEPDIQAEISAKFEDSSEISLPEFLNEEKFNLVTEALKQESVEKNIEYFHLLLARKNKTLHFRSKIMLDLGKLSRHVQQLIISYGYIIYY